MKHILRWQYLCFCLLLLAVPALSQEEEEEDGGATLSPAIQWQLVETAWGRREYDDAAALMTAYAEANPDEPNALEGWWRTYEVYRAYRPNADRRKKTYEKAMAAAQRWAKKYAESDKQRASVALWYQGNLLNNEGLRAAAITAFQELVTKYPGTAYEQHAYWALAEWQREAKNYQEALKNYAAYRKVVGITDQAAMAVYREGWIYEDLKDKANAAASYKSVLTGDYNWGWWNTAWGALDAAKRLKAMGEEELSRSIALKIIDKSPAWGDLHQQAQVLLGQVPGKNVLIVQYYNQNFSTDKINLDANSKVNLKRDLQTLVRLSYVTKELPFKGIYTVIPKVAMDKSSDAMKKVTADDKTAYSAEIIAPDANGNVQGDRWFNFVTASTQTNAPGNVVVTRKWEKAGAGWGQSTIRIQSGVRWDIWIYLPNEKTNPNNFSVQPYDVHEGGKTFRWLGGHHDVTQGLTLKFPIEVGGNVQEYYPKVVLTRGAAGGFADKSALGTEATMETKDMVFKLNATSDFPYTLSSPGSENITLEEISR